MSKILLTPTHYCLSVLLTQAQTGQLGHPLERNSCLGNILPVSHHEEGRQTGEVQGNRVRLQCSHKVRRIFKQLLSLSACPFSKWLREECRQVKDLLSGTPVAILPLLPAKHSLPHCYPEVNRSAETRSQLCALSACGT